MYKHYSVLLNEAVALLALPSGLAQGPIIDGTVGAGGHSLALLQNYPHIQLIALDADGQMLNLAQKRLSAYAGRVKFYNLFFDDFLTNYPTDLPNPAAILLDLGISSYHYETGRGFSFNDNLSLDMRIGADGPSAAQLINTLTESELANLLYRNADEQFSRPIAKAIVKARTAGEIVTAKQLADIIVKALPHQHNKSKYHIATKSFQALRITANDELGRLQRTLQPAFNLLPAGGKLAIISFHSIEDRLVKQYFAGLTKRCQCPPNILICNCSGPLAHDLTKGGLSAGTDELKLNPPSRSARLRVIEKLADKQKN
ncbi:MAG: 16S rRNA (cytosine(1402)-N(4))-methyltransferase RsmH [Spirochaetaceae bacterium]|nr:16S rRNA (cytosine(1402)-N(4))-methyltransferase RsmH [Spirochaetaceae bacterium]